MRQARGEALLGRGPCLSPRGKAQEGLLPQIKRVPEDEEAVGTREEREETFAVSKTDCHWLDGPWGLDSCAVAFNVLLDQSPATTPRSTYQGGDRNGRDPGPAEARDWPRGQDEGGSELLPCPVCYNE